MNAVDDYSSDSDAEASPPKALPRASMRAVAASPALAIRPDAENAANLATSANKPTTGLTHQQHAQLEHASDSSAMTAQDCASMLEVDQVSTVVTESQPMVGEHMGSEAANGDPNCRAGLYSNPDAVAAVARVMDAHSHVHGLPDDRTQLCSCDLDSPSAKDMPDPVQCGWLSAPWCQHHVDQFVRSFESSYWTIATTASHS